MKLSLHKSEERILLLKKDSAEILQAYWSNHSSDVESVRNIEAENAHFNGFLGRFVPLLALTFAQEVQISTQSVERILTDFDTILAENVRCVFYGDTSRH